MHAVQTLSVPSPSLQSVRRVLARPLETRTWIFGLLVVGLNLLDAFATLRHLDHGAEELNPLMQALLRHGELWFLGVKHLLASVGVLGIAAHPHVRAARVALWILLPLYCCIAVYQILLFFLIP